MSIASRRQSREIALQVLFQKEFAPQIDIQECLNLYRRSFTAPEEVWKYTELLLAGISKSKPDIDGNIATYSHNWKIERMALVDKNILRIAIFELKYADNSVPPASAINEAIEIAKKYSTTDSSAFINGLLDQIK